MKRAFSLLVVTVMLCLPIKGGETNGPPSPAPPPCTENCGTGQSVTASPIPTWVLLLIIQLTPRP